MKLFKKLKNALNAACTLALCLALCAAAAPTERINWYFSKPGGNRRPTVLDGKYKDLDALYLGPEGEKKIYLTFDAGYANENVDKIIEVLNAHKAPAAFFILPGLIKNSPETLDKMVKSGFTICNHSTHHGDISKITDKNALKAELEGVENAYRQATGRELAKFFRPPEGAFSLKTLEMLNELGYTPVFWSYAYADWDNARQPDPQKSKADLLDAAHDGMVLLLHPTSATNAKILDEVLTELENRGYTFGTLDELLASAETAR